MIRTWKAIVAITLIGLFVAGCNKQIEPTNDVNNGNQNDSIVDPNNGGGNNNSSDVQVTTFEPQDVTINSATGGGNVISLDGSFILMKGICWSNRQQPTTDDFYSENGTGSGDFTAFMYNLFMDSVYYVRAYAVTANGTTYGEQITFSTKNGVPEVVTEPVSSITSWNAKGSGNLISDGGVASTYRGICWSKTHNPTIEDNHTNNGVGLGTFYSTMNWLEANTTYFIRAYASNAYYTVYGDEVSFITTISDIIDHEYVDLGLPSGTLWATCNLAGSDWPYGYSACLAWAETSIKPDYSWTTYKYCNGEYNQLTKYCGKSDFGYNGFVDNLSVLLPDDDVATTIWGAGWHIPTKEQWEELYNNTTITWNSQNGARGLLFTANNGLSIFLPTVESQGSSGHEGYGDLGIYWSSSLCTDSPDRAWLFWFFGNYGEVGHNNRYNACCIRPVRQN